MGVVKGGVASAAVGVAAFLAKPKGRRYIVCTPRLAEVAQALLMVMRRGSLRAAEEMTGHT